MQEKELEIPKEFMLPEWQTNKVKIRKWNLGLRNEIVDATTTFDVQRVDAQKGRRASAKVQEGYGQVLTITKCTTAAPWQVGSIPIVGELDPGLGDWLYGAIMELNSGGTKNPPASEESSKDSSLEQKKKETQ